MSAQESIEKLAKIAGQEVNQETQQVPIGDFPSDLFDNEPETETQLTSYYQEPLPPPIKSKRAKPFLALFAVSGGLLFFFSMVTRGCSGGSQVEPISKKDGEAPISKTAQIIANQDAQIEKLTRKIEDLQAIKTAGGKDKLKDKNAKGKGTKTPASPAVAQVASYSPPIESYRPIIPEASVPATYTPPRPTVAEPPASPVKDDRSAREIASLKEQVQQMKLAQAVADKPQAMEDTPPVQDVVNLQDSTVAQVNGGIEEQAILTDLRIAEVPVGTEVIAVLDTPITGQQSPVLMTLKSDVADASGKLTLAKGTRLLGTSNNLEGVIQVNLTSAVVNGKQVPLPPQGVFVYKADKSPLIAQKIKGGNGVGKAVLSALLDGGTAIATGLTQARQTSQFNSANGTFSSTTNSDPTLGNALIAGGGAIAQSIGGNFKNSLQQSGDTPQIYGVKAGTELSLVFSAPIQMLTASAALPPESNPAPIADPSASSQEQQILATPDQIQPTPDMFIH
jgi:hypothetical protein